jgi:hypothetical protein
MEEADESFDTILSWINCGFPSRPGRLQPGRRHTCWETNREPQPIAFSDGHLDRCAFRDKNNPPEFADNKPDADPDTQSDQYNAADDDPNSHPWPTAFVDARPERRMPAADA